MRFIYLSLIVVVAGCGSDTTSNPPQDAAAVIDDLSSSASPDLAADLATALPDLTPLVDLTLPCSDGAALSATILKVSTDQKPPVMDNRNQVFTIDFTLTSCDGQVHVVVADVDAAQPLWGDVTGPTCGNFNGVETDFSANVAVQPGGGYSIVAHAPGFCVNFPAQHTVLTGGFAGIRLVDLQTGAPLGPFQKVGLSTP
jgi:hypothetical protein